MQIMVFIKKNKLILISVVLILLICGLLATIYYLGPLNNSSQNSQSTIGSDLKGYASLKNKLNSLNLSGNIIFSRAIAKLNLLEDKTVSKKDRYAALTQAVTFIKQLYSMTHNPKLYPLIAKDFNSFAKNNFKDYYKAADFNYFCQDPTCADTPKPKEIQAIIDEINAITAVPEEERKSLSDNLLNTTYISDKSPIKAPTYMLVAQIVRTDPAITQEGLNNKIADEIVAFVKSHYTDKQINLGATPTK